ncbi:MAG: cytochrome b N-terminal domain-containing protein [Gammaproteobacteria bacterium]|jgi:ubiquinol-cytochrome c reductase cytochrome b subunit|nr:cytochrome b N-terminal domain-containing protein [Gammaproteobacteria bacterium]
MEKFMQWIDERYPLTETYNEHLAKYYAPKNFNWMYYFGSLALLMLVVQIVTGIFLTMHYKPDARLAFESVEYIMRDVPWGWLMRYLHAVGASFFFIVVYLHMLRGMLYGSHRSPRELLWLVGMVIFLCLMAEAFMGYLLPWGNMSYWGAQVIISLFGAIPYVGDGLTEWIRGDFVVADATLNRFFALHVIALPLVLAGLVFVHLIALHKVGSNNPDGIEIKKNKGPDGIPVDGIPFHPYYTVKDLVGVSVFLMIYFAVVFFMPEFFGWFLEHDNFTPANLLQTPTEIKPLWYFTPFYSILRATTNTLLPYLAGVALVTMVLAVMAVKNLIGRALIVGATVVFIAGLFTLEAKFWGVVLMGLSIVLLALLPWLDRSPVKSIRYRGWMYKTAITVFCINFLLLGWLGTQGVDETKTLLAQVGTIIYLLFFVLMPVYTSLDKTRPVPERLTK